MASPSDAPQKKRCWGKSTQREKISIVENMELEVPDRVVISSFNTQSTSTGREKSVDLQHPELLSNEVLVRLLTERLVPIPVYENGSASRERLVYLFRKHVVPRPQRKNRQRQNNKDSSDCHGDTQNMECGDWRLWDEGGNGCVLGKRLVLHIAWNSMVLLASSHTHLLLQMKP